MALGKLIVKVVSSSPASNAIGSTTKILDVGLHDDRNDDRIHGVAPFDRIGRFGLGSRFELQIGPSSLLLREVDTVAIGILRGSLRIVHVVLAAGKDKKCQQER